MSELDIASLGWIAWLFAAWIGLAFGSFLNVVVYRLPVMMHRQWDIEASAHLNLAPPQHEPDTFNLVTPPSRCPNCSAPVRSYQNIPVLSWLWLRGKCASCATPIPARYPAVELLTMIMTLAVVWVYGFGWLSIAALGFTWSAITLTFIDFDTKLLPDQITLPLLWAGLIVNLFGGFVPLQDAVIGAAAGYLFLWSTYWAFRLLTGKEGMGYGDFKLLAAIGAWLGWQVLPAVALIASVFGLLYALAGRFSKTLGSGEAIAFGPFLAAAGWVSLIARDTVVSLFLGTH